LSDIGLSYDRRKQASVEGQLEERQIPSINRLIPATECAHENGTSAVF